MVRPQHDLPVDIEESIRLLSGIEQDGTFTLTAINPNTNFVAGKTFRLGDTSTCIAWIGSFGLTYNVYYHLNTTDGRKPKASKTDIQYVRGLHVDIDPRPGYDRADERSRILHSLRNPPDGIPPPTVIIDSGNGYQAIWLFPTPIFVGGNITKIEEIEQYNIQLAKTFGADNVHDLSRLLRLAGTINIPNQKKLKLGRIPQRSAIIELDKSKRYELTDFPFSSLKQIHLPQSGSVPAPSASVSPVQHFRLEDLDKWGVDSRIKTIIVTGSDPDKPKITDNSRSAWVWDVLCHLVRAGVPEQIILTIFLTSAFGISESILGRGSKAQTYATKQIEAAKLAAFEPEIHELNQKHAVLENEGGCTLVMSIEQSPDFYRPQVILQRFVDFKNRYLHRKFRTGTDRNGKPIYTKLGQAWLEHPARRQYAGLTFRPDQPQEIDGYFNLWEGFAVNPVKGCWLLMQQHILYVLANGNPDYASYILRWAAWAVQNPALQAEVVLVFRGGKGTGKSTFCRLLKDLFGNHGLQISNISHLTGKFNAHLRNLCLLFADEAYWPGHISMEGEFKRLVSEPTLAIEGKGRDVTSVKNCLKILMASNSKWVVPASGDERRYAVFNVSESRVGDKAYFDALNSEMRTGGLEAMLFDLLNQDLANWHPRQEIPQTSALSVQKQRSMSPEDEWIFSLLQRGQLPRSFSGDGFYDVPENITSSLLLFDDARKTVPSLKSLSDPKLAQILKEWGCKNETNGKRRGWAFPTLGTMREAFITAHPYIEWDDTAITEWMRPSREDPAF